MTTLDSVLLAPLEADIPQVVRELCLSLDNFWFSAHLLDLLHQAGALGQAEGLGAGLREFLLLDLATCLCSHHSLADWCALFGPLPSAGSPTCTAFALESSHRYREEEKQGDQHGDRERPAQHSHSDVLGTWHESASKLEQRRSNGLGAQVGGLEVHHLPGGQDPRRVLHQWHLLLHRLAGQSWCLHSFLRSAHLPWQSSTNLWRNQSLVRQPLFFTPSFGQSWRPSTSW